MKKETLLVIGLAGLLTYLYLRNKKKKEQNISGNMTPSLAASDVIPKTTVDLKAPVTLEDLSKKPATPMATMEPTVVIPKQEPVIKEPIYIPSSNLWPNIYDRGVGAPLPTKAPQDQYYASFAGACSEDIQTACSCVKEKDQRYRLDIPNLL